MRGKWSKKDKPVPLTLLEKDKLILLEWEHRTAFWARRIKMAAQPRKTQEVVNTPRPRILGKGKVVR